MEDYKKKYEEALERAKKWKEKSGMPSDRKGILDDIFPELKESEDEKIRKALIHLVSSSKELYFGIDSYDGVMWKSIIAWLEKQSHENRVHALITEYEKGKGDAIAELTPEDWTNADDETLNSICAMLQDKKNDKPFDMPSYWDKLISWLKSIKYRVQPQPKQEWSVDDKQYLLVCKNALYKYQQSDHWDANIIYNWLESLKERCCPNWKPRGEQIDALEIAIKVGIQLGSWEEKALTDLLNTLKKR